MSNSVVISTAICLPAPDIEALIQGRVIAAISKNYIVPERQFALYPADASTNLLPVEQYYNSNFLPIAQTILTQLNDEVISIKGWVKCEKCEHLNNTESLASLSPLTIWTTEALQEILTQRHNIFLLYLRVYQLPQLITLSIKTSSQFVFLGQPLTISEVTPVLSDRIFAQRKQQLENRQPPLHPELEELQSVLASLSITNPSAKKLDNDIKIFLGWSSNNLSEQKDSELAWINDIAKLGNRSKQEDEGKSNYQAGTDFENVVRDSLDFLGFTVDRTHKGGAGGLDLFCSQPYPLFGECKAGKKIPNDTAVQLLNLGSLHRLDVFNQAVKLIIGPGEPTNQLKEAATVHSMAIINPETLEKLVKLQSKYRNSVDLFKLKEYLKPGQSDEEVEKYIDQIYISINLRSQMIAVVKELSEQDNDNSKSISQNFTVTEIRVHYNATHNPKLTDEVVRDLLIELSSPLTGYLGRDKGSDWRSDRFYFLRDLPISSK